MALVSRSLPRSSWRRRRHVRAAGLALVALLGASALGGCVGDPGRNDKEYQQRQEREREQRRIEREARPEATTSTTSTPTTTSTSPDNEGGG
jgi:hypothetical protein